MATDYTEDQLRDLLELWERNSQGLSESHMNALAAWDKTPAEIRARIVPMIAARRTGVAPQRVSETEQAFLKERGLGPEPEAPHTRKRFGRGR